MPLPNINPGSPINKSGLSIPRPKEAVKTEGKSIFDKKEGITRPEFRHVLRENHQGSGMSASEGARIEKRDFSSHYGTKISRNDVRNSAYRLHQEILNSGTSEQEKAKIRKDINYLKKISKL